MTKQTALSLLAIAALAVVSAGCGSNLCDRSAKSSSGKTGSCPSQSFDALGGRCSSAESACADNDQRVLEELVACFEKLPACAASDESSWVSAKGACYARVSELSEGCRNALFEGGVTPGTDAGFDAGQPPGPSADLDGGGALDVVAVADETDFAVAWTRTQSGFVPTWQVHSESGVGVAFPISTVNDPNRLFFSLPDVGANASRTFFVWGVGADGGVLSGTPFNNSGADAGAPLCTLNTDCALDRVCDLGTCKALPCTSTTQCPAGYLCENINTFKCFRNYNPDGGTAVVIRDAGAQDGPRPFISEAVTVTVGPASYGERAVSPFVAEQDPDIVGIDSARQVVTVQQFGQIYVHTTEDRGRTWRTVAVDPLGQNPHVTYNKDSRQIFVCYQAGSSVRVRTSLDLGKTWSSTVAEVALPDPGDGGLPPAVTDCDIAPWRDGGVMLSVLEQDRIVTYTISSGLAVATRDEAFINEASTDAGTTLVFNAQKPSIATLPDEYIAHVVFVGTRNLVGGTTDRDVYGVYRDPARTGGTFSNRMRISGGSTGAQGQILDQTKVQVALEPGTGRAVATFESEEASGTGGTYLSVYLALFSKVGTNPYAWATGSDLNIFARGTANTYIVLTDRPPTGPQWNAVSPSVTFTGKNRGLLTFGASVTGSPSNIYTVGFSFDVNSPIGGKGWFLPPAQKITTIPLVDLGNTPKRGGPVISGDAQISSYVLFIEGVGGAAQTPNRPMMLARPQQ